MIYVDWSPSLKFFVRCDDHQDLDTGFFETLDEVHEAIRYHRQDYNCTASDEGGIGKNNWEQLEAIERDRKAGKLDGLGNTTTGYKALDYREEGE